jgi:hypothetical protein
MANTLLLSPDSRPTAGVLVILALVCQVLADGAGVASLAFGAVTFGVGLPGA